MDEVIRRGDGYYTLVDITVNRQIEELMAAGAIFIRGAGGAFVSDQLATTFLVDSQGRLYAKNPVQKGRLSDLVLLAGGATINYRVRLYGTNGTLCDSFQGTLTVAAGSQTLAQLKGGAILLDATYPDDSYGEIDVWGAAGAVLYAEYGQPPTSTINAPQVVGTASTAGNFNTYQIGRFPS